MPLDVEAVVLGNRRLSSEYNVLELAAPAIAAGAEPGQFVRQERTCGRRGW